MPLEKSMEIGGRDRVWKLYRLDIAPLVEQGPARRRHGFGNQQFLLVGRHFHPLTSSQTRKPTANRVALPTVKSTASSVSATGLPGAADLVS